MKNSFIILLTTFFALNIFANDNKESVLGSIVLNNYEKTVSIVGEDIMLGKKTFKFDGGNDEEIRARNGSARIILYKGATLKHILIDVIHVQNAYGITNAADNICGENSKAYLVLIEKNDENDENYVLGNCVN